MKINGKFVPANSCKAQTLQGLEESEQQAKVEAYEKLDQRRRLLIVKIRKWGYVYSVVIHKEVLEILDQAETIYPGITATKRAGWGRITGWLQNVSYKKLIQSSHLTWKEFGNAVETGIFDQQVNSPEEVIRLMEWKLGCSIQKVAKDHTDNQDFLAMASKIATVYREIFKDEPKYEEFLAELTKERTLSVNKNDQAKVIQEVVDLLCRLMNSLTTAKRGMLIYLALYSPNYQTVTAMIVTDSVWAMDTWRNGYWSEDYIDFPSDFSAWLNTQGKHGCPVDLKPAFRKFCLC